MQARHLVLIADPFTRFVDRLTRIGKDPIGIVGDRARIVGDRARIERDLTRIVGDQSLIEHDLTRIVAPLTPIRSNPIPGVDDPTLIALRGLLLRDHLRDRAGALDRELLHLAHLAHRKLVQQGRDLL